MYRLAVDYAKCKKGAPVRIKNDGVYIEFSVSEFMIGFKSDLQTLIEHGMIEEIQEPEFTKNDMIAFVKYWAGGYYAELYEREFYNFIKQKENNNGL